MAQVPGIAPILLWCYGPRRYGRTTMIRAAFPQAFWAPCDPAAPLAGHRGETVVVLDGDVSRLKSACFHEALRLPGVSLVVVVACGLPATYGFDLPDAQFMKLAPPGWPFSAGAKLVAPAPQIVHDDATAADQ